MGIEEIKILGSFGGTGVALALIWFMKEDRKNQHEEREQLNTLMTNHFAHVEESNKIEAKAKVRLALSLDRNTSALKNMSSRLFEK